jgi:hypothetical protein
MRTVAKEIFFVILLVTFSFLVSKYIWLMPLILFLPITLTYTVDNPLIYLVLLGIFAELFAFSPPGLIFIVALLPWIIYMLLGKLQVDMSLLFAAVVLLTVLLQIGIIYSSNIYIAKDILVVPWLTVIPMILFTSIVALLTSVAVFFNRSE